MGGGGVTCSHITRLLEGELLRQTSAAPRMPSGVSHRGPGLLAAETISYSPSIPHGSWNKPEFLEVANLGECSSVKAPGFTGEESAAHAQPASCCSFVKSIFNPSLLDSLALGSGVLRVLSIKS